MYGGEHYPWLCGQCRSKVTEAARLLEALDIRGTEELSPELPFRLASRLQWLCGGRDCRLMIERDEPYGYPSLGGEGEEVI